MDTNKRQTTLEYVWLVGRVSALSLRPIGCTSAVCDMKPKLQLQYADCGAIQVLYAFASLYGSECWSVPSGHLVGQVANLTSV